MTRVSFLISQSIKDVDQLARHLSILHSDNFQIDLIIMQYEKLSKDDLSKLNSIPSIKVQEVPLTDDEDLLFRDVMENLSGDYLLNYVLGQVYPADFLENVFQIVDEDKNMNIANRPAYSFRLLRSVQQSKYGLGVVKHDIKRSYPELNISSAYNKTSFTKLNFLELEISESFAEDLKELANRLNIEKKSYSPNYKEIQYFEKLKPYLKAIHEDAPHLSFKNKPNAIGLPIYLLIFILLCLFLSPFYLTAIFPFLIVSALYLLALTLESLAISTMKKQGDLFLGMMLLFPIVHIYYLWSYIIQLGRSK